MAQITRLKDAEIQDGNVIEAADISAELDSLVSESNGQDNRLNDVETNNLVIDGVKTFTSNPKMNGVDERSAGAGFTADGVLLKDSTVKASVTSDPSSPDDGTVWYNSTTDKIKIRENGTTKNIATETYVDNTAGIPKGYLSPSDTAAPVYASASTFTIDSFYGKSSDNTEAIEITSQKTVNIANSGLNGRATNYTEGTSEYIYVYAINDSLSATSTPGYLLSDESVASGGSIAAGLPYDESGALTGTVATSSGTDAVTGTSTTFLTDYVAGQTISITGGDDLVVQSVDSDTAITATANATATVSGAAHERWSPYDKYRQLPFVIRNDGSGNFIPWKVGPGWPTKPTILYRDSVTHYDGATQVGALNVLENGTSPTFAAVDCSALMPPESEIGYFQFFASSGDCYVRTTGQTNYSHATGGTGLIGSKQYFETNSSQSIDYRDVAGSGGLYVDVAGFVITGI